MEMDMLLMPLMMIMNIEQTWATFNGKGGGGQAMVAMVMGYYEVLTDTHLSCQVWEDLLQGVHGG